MQLVKSCVCYLRKRMKENQSSLSREDCWPSLLPANVGWVCYLFFFSPMQLPSALLCVYPISWKREREEKKKRFWNSSQSTHSFLFHRLFKIWFLVVVVVVDKRKGLLKNQIVKYREEGKKTSFFFSLFWGCMCVCVWTFPFIYIFFFSPAIPMYGQ